MSGEKKDKKFKESFVDSFIEFFYDSNGSTGDELEKELINDGINTTTLIKNVQQMVDDALDKERLSWQQQAISSREKNCKKFSDKTKNFLGLSKDKLVDRVRKICQTCDPEFSFAHRNLKPEDLSEEELRDILSEYEQLGDNE
ncbi:MAG: hypothetical protein AB7U29_18560 [Desulfobulbus sp.]